MDFLFLCLAWPKYQKFTGHQSKVTCLLYPYGEYERYAPEHFVSGSADFTVKLWNLTTNVLLTSFSANGGEILRLTCTPPKCSVSYFEVVRELEQHCSVSLTQREMFKCSQLI